MPNFASAIKEEITRLARRELKSHTASLKKASTQYRKDIARLKQDAAKLTAALAKLAKTSGNGMSQEQAANGVTKSRFSPKSVISQRKRLGMSAADYGKLVGVSGVTIYAWEQGKSRPQSAQAKALAEVRGIGKREVAKKLEGAVG